MNIEKIKMPDRDLYNDSFRSALIDNQPGLICIDTGFYHINHYGCWHRVRITKITDKTDSFVELHSLMIGDRFYMIGEYPS